MYSLDTSIVCSSDSGSGRHNPAKQRSFIFFVADLNRVVVSSILLMLQVVDGVDFVQFICA